MTAKRPLLVGTVTLDYLHEGPIGRALPPATLRWGGVIHNVACAMAARGSNPLFLTATYTGDLAPAVTGHLAAHGVDRLTLPVEAPLPLFEAQLIDGSVTDKHFVGQEALDLLTPGLLDTRADLFDNASVVVAGTDSHPATLAWLCTAARDRDIPFWLLSADPTEVHKLVPEGQHATFVSLNARELSLWAGADLPDHDAIAAAARELVTSGGHALVTLGPQGAVLVPADGTTPLHQPAPTINGHPLTVGAGDILFACLLSARLTPTPWPQALRQAATLTTTYLTTPAYTALRPTAQ
ncbi:carbohydrate kinase family protein [Streptomyces kaniharaensis]|uniref:Carbohydrate kinase family protein n=1 Tax=Streptomyces kaniharaensis TaxID=212423 RepID=A0A5S9FY42_9ACTN|nr:PfkB family carbohydrate kinase [Streptomyces kaniharaensis]AVW82930.1 phosphofructokinase [Streptomyces kaniharaensis]MQS11323.1 carbohydrate kinase family protein [Streptomyces kaniharaensis]